MGMDNCTHTRSPALTHANTRVYTHMNTQLQSFVNSAIKSQNKRFAVISFCTAPSAKVFSDSQRSASVKSSLREEENVLCLFLKRDHVSASGIIAKDLPFLLLVR